MQAVELYEEALQIFIDYAKGSEEHPMVVLTCPRGASRGSRRRDWCDSQDEFDDALQSQRSLCAVHTQYRFLLLLSLSLSECCISGRSCVGQYLSN